MTEPIVIGQPLPRAGDAYASREKWRRWILTPRGHGNEWMRVFHARPRDVGSIWIGIAREVHAAPVVTMRDLAHGIVCGVVVSISVNNRTAPVNTAWHYEHSCAAPRLVTAYPRSRS